MISFKQYLEEQQRRDVLVYAFGRYNPPTRGHILHFHAVQDYAVKLGCSYEIFISKTVDNKKNPVPVEARIEYIKKAFPQMITPAPTVNMFTVIDTYANSRTKRLVYMAGSDYFENNADKGMFDRLQSYAKEKGIELTVQMSRQREPMGDVSGTALRTAAMNNDFETFLKASPVGMGRLTEKDVRQMFELTKQGLSGRPAIKPLSKI